jgi:diguanylate cyclase (GGDEF)-like protein
MDCRKAREKDLCKLTKTLMGANRRLESLARLDPLTGLPSRRIQDEAVEDEWRRSRRERKPLTFLIADIDCFKTYNESYGHEMGDSCLKVIAEIMASGVRRPGDMVARYGGDKFAAILPGVAQEGAAVIAEKFRKGTHELKIIHKKSEVSNLVTISVGVASVIPNDDNSLTDLIKAANQALCRAKLGGRNKVVI